MSGEWFVGPRVFLGSKFVLADERVAAWLTCDDMLSSVLINPERMRWKLNFRSSYRSFGLAVLFEKGQPSRCGWLGSARK